MATSTAKYQRNGQDIYWAETVSELTECIPWCRQTQAGITSSNLVLEGLRIGGHQGMATHLGDTTIITRCSNTEPSNTSKGDQFPTRLKIAENAVSEKHQLGVVVEKNYDNLKGRGIQLTPKFALMGGWWVMTDYWIDWEVTGTAEIKYLIVRYDKVDFNGIWWGNGVQQPVEATTKPVAATSCGVCNHPYVPRYTGDLFCGRPKCSTSESKEPWANYSGNRQFCQEYLAWRPDMSGLTPPKHDYVPKPPVQPTVNELWALLNEDAFRPGWNGFFCTICKRFNQRTWWNKHSCGSCQNTISMPFPHVEFEDLIDQKWLDLQDDAVIDGMVLAKGVEEIQGLSHPLYVVKGIKMHEDNCLLFAYPKKEAIYGAGGWKELWDRLWSAVQNGDVPIERIDASKKTGPAGMLTAWFGHNYGVPYKTRMEVKNTSFDKAPSIILEIRDKLTATANEIAELKEAFNEMLAIGNYPDQKMNWHDDGEEDVIGQIVTSVSLGSEARMFFGLKDKHSNGKLNNNYDMPIITGCEKEEAKRANQAAFEKGKITEEEYKAKRKELVDSCHAPKHPKKLVEVPLPGTGTIMMQKGRTLNHYYLHMVENTGLVRLVNTARNLRKPEERRATEADDGDDGDEPDKGPSPKKRRKTAPKSTLEADDGDEPDKEPSPKKRRKTTRK